MCSWALIKCSEVGERQETENVFLDYPQSKDVLFSGNSKGFIWFLSALPLSICISLQGLYQLWGKMRQHCQDRRLAPYLRGGCSPSSYLKSFRSENESTKMQWNTILCLIKIYRTHSWLDIDLKVPVCCFLILLMGKKRFAVCCSFCLNIWLTFPVS